MATTPAARPVLASTGFEIRMRSCSRASICAGWNLIVDCLWTPALDSGGDAAGPGSRQRAPSMRTVASASVQDTDGVGVPDRSHAPQRGDRCEPSASLRPAGATPTTWNDGETASTR